MLDPRHLGNGGTVIDLDFPTMFTGTTLAESKLYRSFRFGEEQEGGRIIR